METVNFSLGRIAVTQKVTDLMIMNEAFKHFVQTSLGKHSFGRWGNLSAEEKEMNDRAVSSGGQIRSVYIRSGKKKDDPDGKILIITEADRSATTILFPDEE